MNKQEEKRVKQNEIFQQLTTDCKFFTQPFSWEVARPDNLFQF